MFLMDGLNFNQGDGEATLEDLDLATISHAEIFRGANAFKYGALTLGGAINLVPFTGSDAAPFQIRLEGGSYGFFRGDMSGGAVQGQFDEFGAISFRERDGFRKHSREDTEILFADLGYKFSDHVENRFYLTLDRTNRNLPGGLTKSELENDPTQANPLAMAQDWNKELSNVRLADKLSFRTEDIQLDVGVFWFHHDIENRGFFSPDRSHAVAEGPRMTTGQMVRAVRVGVLLAVVCVAGCVDRRFVIESNIPNAQVYIDDRPDRCRPRPLPVRILRILHDQACAAGLRDADAACPRRRPVVCVPAVRLPGRSSLAIPHPRHPPVLL